MKQIQMQMTDYSVSSEWWKKLITHFIQTNDEIEIRCWKEEISEITQASFYGTPVSDGWEVSIKTIVTGNLLQELQTEDPTDKSIYNKMTKYCKILLKYCKKCGLIDLQKQQKERKKKGGNYYVQQTLHRKN